MAQTVKCQFCGKEMTKGFFKGNTKEISFELAGEFSCCEDCYEKHEKEARVESKRVAAKITNYKARNGKKLSDDNLGEMYRLYLNEKNFQRTKTQNQNPEYFESFYCYNSDGYFWVKEFSVAFSSRDVSAKQMIKSLEKSHSVETFAFDKNDITRIEYRLVNNYGEYLGLRHCAYSYEVRLNDEKVITYKPCITRGAVLGKSFIPFVARNDAKKQIVKILEEFKRRIGCNLPVVEVKKFK